MCFFFLKCLKTHTHVSMYLYSCEYSWLIYVYITHTCIGVRRPGLPSSHPHHNDRRRRARRPTTTPSHRPSRPREHGLGLHVSPEHWHGGWVGLLYFFEEGMLHFHSFPPVLFLICTQDSAKLSKQSALGFHCTPMESALRTIFGI